MNRKHVAPHQREPLPAVAGAEQDQWLTTEATGRERFRLLLQQWLQRNNWSLAVTSRLAELALLAKADFDVPDWSAGMPLKAGDWVNHRGHAWEAIGSPLSEPVDGDPGWMERGLTSRLHASGMNLFLRGKNRTLTSTFFLEVGRLNEWVSTVQDGALAAPQDPRLQKLVAHAVVLRNQEGVVYGAEEMLSIAIGRLVPTALGTPLPAAANEGVSARQLRTAAAAAGLDIIDNWAEIAAMYPSTDPVRLERLQQVIRGLATWDLQQEEDERVGALVLLQALENHRALTQAPDTAEAEAIQLPDDCPVTNS
jgi:hypothetical protein